MPPQTAVSSRRSQYICLRLRPANFTSNSLNLMAFPKFRRDRQPRRRPFLTVWESSLVPGLVPLTAALAGAYRGERPPGRSASAAPQSHLLVSEIRQRSAAVTFAG